MRGDRKWKWLSAVLMGLLVLAVSTPHAVASTTHSVRQMVEHLVEEVAAIRGATEALPDAPASTGDVIGARDQVLAAVGAPGFVRGVSVPASSCRTVVPAASAGHARNVTLTIHVTNIDATALVDLRAPDGTNAHGYIVKISQGHPETLVETASDGLRIDVCNTTFGSSMFVNAQWDDFEV